MAEPGSLRSKEESHGDDSQVTQESDLPQCSVEDGAARLALVNIHHVSRREAFLCGNRKLISIRLFVECHRPHSKRPGTAQLTIFYAGMVNVYDDVPYDKVSLASNQSILFTFSCCDRFFNQSRDSLNAGSGYNAFGWSREDMDFFYRHQRPCCDEATCITTTVSFPTTDNQTRLYLKHEVAETNYNKRCYICSYTSMLHASCFIFEQACIR